MESVKTFYRERVEELNSFLSLIESIQLASRNGAPKIGEAGEITTDHQKILVSTAYIQLYSLLESTVGQSFKYVSEHVANSCRFDELNDNFRREWSDYQAKIHDKDISHERRSTLTLKLIDHISSDDRLLSFKIEKRNAKGWDRKIVEDLSKRIGVNIEVSPDLDNSLKRHYSNDMGPLTFLKVRRGALAHGDISFVQSGDIKSIDDLKFLRDVTCNYLESLLDSFQSFLDSDAYKKTEAQDDPVATNPSSQPATA